MAVANSVVYYHGLIVLLDQSLLTHLHLSLIACRAISLFLFSNRYSKWHDLTLKIAPSTYLLT